MVYSVTPGGKVLRVAVFMRPAAGRALNEGEGGRIVSRVESPAAGFSKGSEILLRGGGRADLSSLGGSAQDAGHVMAVSFWSLRVENRTVIQNRDVALNLNVNGNVSDRDLRVALGREMERLGQEAEDQLNALLPSNSEWQALNSGRDLSLKELRAATREQGGEVFIPEHALSGRHEALCSCLSERCSSGYSS